MLDLFELSLGGFDEYLGDCCGKREGSSSQFASRRPVKQTSRLKFAPPSLRKEAVFTKRHTALFDFPFYYNLVIIDEL